MTDAERDDDDLELEDEAAPAKAKRAVTRPIRGRHGLPIRLLCNGLRVEVDGR